MVAQVVVPPIPAELIVLLAVRRFGIPVTTLVAGGGLFTGSVLVFHGARWFQRRLDRVFRRPKVEKVLSRLRRHATPILWIRVLPYNPSDVISYAAGLLDVPWRRFYAITVCTSFLRCLALGILGWQIEDVASALRVIGLLALSALVAWALVMGWREGRS